MQFYTWSHCRSLRLWWLQPWSQGRSPDGKKRVLCSKYFDSDGHWAEAMAQYKPGGIGLQAEPWSQQQGGGSPLECLSWHFLDRRGKNVFIWLPTSTNLWKSKSILFRKVSSMRLKNEMCRIMRQSIKLLCQRRSPLHRCSRQLRGKFKSGKNQLKHQPYAATETKRTISKIQKHLLAVEGRSRGEFWFRRGSVDALWAPKEDPTRRGLWSPSQRQSYPRYPRSRCADTEACWPSSARG